MTSSFILTPSQIGRLLDQQSISTVHPWNTNDEATIDSFLKNICAEINQITGTDSKIEWNHYGSGYSSFVDAWFYRPINEFSVPIDGFNGESYLGLVVLLCRLSPHFVLMEGGKTWHSKGGSSYLPSYGDVDLFASSAVSGLASEIQPVLEQYGLQRLSSRDLGTLLAPDVQVPTIMTDPPFRTFDAMFYWED